jgi:hypothetical protein
MGIANGFGAFLHFASAFFMPGFCQLCRLLPRGNADEGDQEDGFSPKATAAAQLRSTAAAIGDFIP